jgi:sortase A
MLTGVFLAVGMWKIGEGSWIYAKARLAQVLLERAWTRALAGETQVTPWPWADTWPVGRLRVPSEHIDLIVLSGAYGRTLAFGPAFVESSSLPGTGGTTVLTGHRDTHFAFLRRLKEGDDITIDTPDGRSIGYRVHESRIVDARTDAIRLDGNEEKLILLTCYPFDAILAGGPLRYLVTTTRVPFPRSIDRPGETEWKAREGLTPSR